MSPLDTLLGVLVTAALALLTWALLLWACDRDDATDAGLTEWSVR